MAAQFGRNAPAREGRDLAGERAPAEEGKDGIPTVGRTITEPQRDRRRLAAFLHTQLARASAVELAKRIVEAPDAAETRSLGDARHRKLRVLDQLLGEEDAP